MEAQKKVKPKLRGVSHFFAALAAVVGGVFLLQKTPDSRSWFAALIYSLALFLLFAISALYHWPMWSERPRLWLKRLDHANIYILIAGTMTPLAVLEFDRAQGSLLLWIVWLIALVGVLQSMVWVKAPRWLGTILYLGMGWLGVVYMPHFVRTAGVRVMVLLLVGGVLYSIGAVFYALKRPNPFPGVFGYHEVFHVLVILAALSHYLAIYEVVGA